MRVKYSKVDYEEAQAQWKAAWNPKVITLTNSDRIFFDGYSRPGGRERYFVAPGAECGLDFNILTPQGVEEDSIDAPCMTPRKRRQTPYKNIRSMLHDRTESRSCDRATGVRRQPDFLRMPESSEVDEEHYITFTEDRRPDHCASDDPPLLCPDTLDAMLQIVSNVRQGRMDVLRDQQVQAARTYVAALSDEEVGESEGSMFPLYLLQH